MTAHLDDARWAALQQAPDAALLEHLKEGCEICDAFLASVPGLDARVDAALLECSPSRGKATDLQWAAFKRRQRAPAPMRWAALAAALAVLAAGAVTAATWRSAQTAEGEKGMASAQLSLRGAFEPRDGPLTFFDSGARIASSATVVVQANSNRSGPARLFLQRAGAAPEELTHLELSAGLQELSRADRSLLGVSLAGEAGPVTLWLVAGERAFTAEEGLAAIDGGVRHGLAVANLRVDVVP